MKIVQNYSQGNSTIRSKQKNKSFNSDLNNYFSPVQVSRRLLERKGHTTKLCIKYSVKVQSKYTSLKKDNVTATRN